MLCIFNLRHRVALTAPDAFSEAIAKLHQCFVSCMSFSALH
jgi:hypothetical protein